MRRTFRLGTLRTHEASNVLRLYVPRLSRANVNASCWFELVSIPFDNNRTVAFHQIKHFITRVILKCRRRAGSKFEDAQRNRLRAVCLSDLIPDAERARDTRLAFVHRRNPATSL